MQGSAGFRLLTYSCSGLAGASLVTVSVRLNDWLRRALVCCAEAPIWPIEPAMVPDQRHAVEASRSWPRGHRPLSLRPTLLGPNSSRQCPDYRPTLAHACQRSRPMRPLSPSKTQGDAAEAQAEMFVRMPTVVRMTGLGRSTIYRLMAEDKFPAPVRLAKRAVAWRRVDLERWGAAHPTIRHWADRKSRPSTCKKLWQGSAHYTVIASFSTSPISRSAATTLPQRHVVNQ